MRLIASAWSESHCLKRVKKKKSNLQKKMEAFRVQRRRSYEKKRGENKELYIGFEVQENSLVYPLELEIH